MRRKAWGWSMLLEQRDDYQLWLCRGDKGYSSKHFHANLANSLYILSGCLDVILFNSLEGEEEVRRLYPADAIVILPRENHRLIVVEPGYFAEAYYPSNDDRPVDWDDIVRYDESSSEDWRP